MCNDKTKLTIPTNERLMFALDVPTTQEAIELMYLINGLQCNIKTFKLGLELFSTGDVKYVFRTFKRLGLKIFADVKLYDIPETVYRSTKNLVDLGADFVTVHATLDTVDAAVRATEGSHTKVLAVSVLTSVDTREMRGMGYTMDIPTLAMMKIGSAIRSGAHGIVCSGHETVQARKVFADNDFLIVNPGIRPAGGDNNDQKRVVTVQQAFENGADYIVVGRPIRDAGDPEQAAQDIQNEIGLIFSK